MFSREEECFGDAGAAKRREEGFLDFAGCQWWIRNMIIGNHKGIVMFREVRECEDIEDFIWKVCDDAWFREVCNRMLFESASIHEERVADEPRIQVYPNSINRR